MAAPKPDPAAALATMIRPLLHEAVTQINDKNGAQHTEVLLAIQELTNRLQVLEGAVAGKKAAKPRAPKPAGAPAEGGDAAAAAVADAGADAAGAAPVVVPPGEAKAFALNKLIWFKNLWKVDPAFRTKYMELPGVTEAVNGNKTIQDKVKPEQKLIAESQYVWNHLKEHNAPKMDEIGRDYDAAKKAFAAANAAPPNEKEPVTPPAEVKK